VQGATQIAMTALQLLLVEREQERHAQNLER
jgi:hypothetical protein